MPFNPIFFAAVAVVAIGVVIYELVSNQNKPYGRPPDRPGYGGRPPDRPGNGGRPPDRPGYGRRPPDRPGYGGRPPDRPGYGGRPSDRPDHGEGPPYRPGNGKSPSRCNHPKNKKSPSPPNSPQQSSPIDSKRSSKPETSTDSKIGQHSNSSVNNLRRRNISPSDHGEGPPDRSGNGKSPSRCNYPKNKKSPSPPNSPQQSSPIDSKRSSKPETSTDSKIVQHSNSSVNNLRRRNINPSENAVEVSKATTVREESEKFTTGRQNNQDEKFDESNYCRNVLDKLTNDAKDVNVNMRNENISGHNICEEESDSSENNLLQKEEKKLINQIKTDENVSKSNRQKHKGHASKDATDCGSRLRVANIDPLLNIGSDRSSLDEDMNNTEPDSLSLDEKLYVREVHAALKTDVNDNKENNPHNSDICLSESIEIEMLSEHSSCKACEEKQINTRAYPCNHAYLCVDCAVRIFRVCKTCSVCLANVVEFVEFAS